MLVVDPDPRISKPLTPPKTKYSFVVYSDVLGISSVKGRGGGGGIRGEGGRRKEMEEKMEVTM